MANKFKYDGYMPYDYLDEGDYTKYELAKQIDRVEEYLVPLTDEEFARVERIAEEKLYISLHEHPNLKTENLKRDSKLYITEGRDHYAYEALSQGYYDVIFDNMMDGTAVIHSKNGWKWSEIIHDLGMRKADIAHQELITTVETVADIENAKKDGKIGMVFVVEGAAPLENEVDRVDILYGLGVRLMGITYSQSNGLGSGLKEDFDGGLTFMGRQVVRRMNNIGMTIDCSHCGDKTTLDVVEASTKPIFLSHIGAKALWPIKRLAPDEVLQAVAAKGGVIGIECAPHTAISKEHPAHSIESFMDHFKYIVDLVGIDHVAFGPDSLYGDHVGIHDLHAAQFSSKDGEGLTFPKQKYVLGLENPTEASKNILRWLVKNGYTNEEIEKVISGNIMRVLKETWRK